MNISKSLILLVTIGAFNSSLIILSMDPAQQYAKAKQAWESLKAEFTAPIYQGENVEYYQQVIDDIELIHTSILKELAERLIGLELTDQIKGGLNTVTRNINELNDILEVRRMDQHSDNKGLAAEPYVIGEITKIFLKDDQKFGRPSPEKRKKIYDDEVTIITKNFINPMTKAIEHFKHDPRVQLPPRREVASPEHTESVIKILKFLFNPFKTSI